MTPLVLSSRALSKPFTTSEGAHVEDLGTPVLDFPDHLDGSETVFIIDAVENSKTPGSITVYTKTTS